MYIEIPIARTMQANRNMIRRLAFNSAAVLQIILPENLSTSKLFPQIQWVHRTLISELDMIPKILLLSDWIQVLCDTMPTALEGQDGQVNEASECAGVA